jgi:hypothetical protein
MRDAKNNRGKKGKHERRAEVSKLNDHDFLTKRKPLADG